MRYRRFRAGRTRALLTARSDVADEARIFGHRLDRFRPLVWNSSRAPAFRLRGPHAASVALSRPKAFRGRGNASGGSLRRGASGRWLSRGGGRDRRGPRARPDAGEAGEGREGRENYFGKKFKFPLDSRFRIRIINSRTARKGNGPKARNPIRGLSSAGRAHGWQP